MSSSLGRRAFLQGLGLLLTLGAAGCTRTKPVVDAHDQAGASDGKSKDSASDTAEQEETTMRVSVIVNDVPFTATVEDTDAGRELLSRLPLTLSMDELHGNEKYCHTGEVFGGEQQVPDTIEAGDLMVFGSDCLVLFYETFSNGGWSYARVGKIDDPAGLAGACGSGVATVTFDSVVQSSGTA